MRCSPAARAGAQVGELARAGTHQPPRGDVGKGRRRIPLREMRGVRQQPHVELRIKLLRPRHATRRLAAVVLAVQH